MYNNYQEGWIEVITGCMFAGKTEEFMRRIRRLKYAKREVLIFKPDIDTRYDQTSVVSHNGQLLPSIVVSPTKPEQILQVIQEHEAKLTPAAKKIIIAIDEVQFFELKIVTIINQLANNHRIIVAGLDSDFRAEPFPVMCELLARAEFVTKLDAICVRCGAAATRTQRLSNGLPARIDEPIIDIGAQDKYEARCRRHHQLIIKNRNDV